MKKKKVLKEKDEINRMIDEGLGAGQIVEEIDKEKLAAPPEQKGENHIDKVNIDEINNGEMAPTLKDMQKLGKEMEQMDTNKELKEKGLQPDPSQ